MILCFSIAFALLLLSFPSFSIALNSTISSLFDSADRLCVLSDDRSAVYLSTPENVPKGTSLGTLPVIGNSSGPNPNIRLKLVLGHEYVRLNALRKQLELRKELDREQGISRFNAVVECSPMPASSSASSQHTEGVFPLNISVFVAVIDVNDNAPQFANGSRFSISIPEELPEGTPIPLDFEAHDRDQPGPNSHIRYRIVGMESMGDTALASGEFAYYDIPTDYSDHAPLSIPDPFRPEIVVSGRIDFERMSKFTIQIEAEDHGRPKLKTTARLEVNVTDVDDLNPKFSEALYTCRKTKGSKLVIEPGAIRAWDGDRSFNESIVFTLSGEHSANFAIDQLNGVISLLADKLVPANLIIRATQVNRPERSATAFLVVQPAEMAAMDVVASDVAKHSEITFLKIPSNLDIHTKLIRIEHATIIGPPKSASSPLYIDNKSNALCLARQLHSGEYNVNVSVNTTGQLLQIRLVVFDPSVTAISEHLPEFEKKLYEFELSLRDLDKWRRSEGQSSIRIGKIMAKLGEEERNRTAAAEDRNQTGISGNIDVNTIQYSLLNGNSHFDIDPDSGVLSAVRNPLGTSDPSDGPFPVLSELIVAAHFAKGPIAFVRCVVRAIGDHRSADTNSLPPPSALMSISPALLSLGMLCFLLLVTNCATISLWLGKRRFKLLHDQLAYRYDSVEGRTKCSGFDAVGAGGYSTPPFARGNGSLEVSKNNYGSWMLNRSLEGVSITTTTTDCETSTGGSR